MENSMETNSHFFCIFKYYNEQNRSVQSKIDTEYNFVVWVFHGVGIQNIIYRRRCGCSGTDVMTSFTTDVIVFRHSDVTFKPADLNSPCVNVTSCFCRIEYVSHPSTRNVPINYVCCRMYKRARARTQMVINSKL